MRQIGIVLLAFLLLALESPLLHEGGVASFTPDLVLLIVIYLGLTTTYGVGITLALVLGLLKDGFTTAPVGMYMELMVLAFMVSYRLSRRLALRGPLTVMFVALLFSLSASVVELILSLVFDRGFSDAAGGPEVILSSMVPQALATAPFGPVIFWLFERLDNLTSRRKSDSVYLG